MPLSVFEIVDNHGRTRIVAHGMVSSESFEEYQWVYEHFRRHMNRKHPLSLMVDADPAVTT